MSAVSVTLIEPGASPVSTPAPQSGELESAPNMAASIAAAEALSSGKNIDEAIAAAQTAAAGAGDNKPPAPDAPPAEDDEREAVLRRRWLIAVCRYGHGEYERLSISDLLDTACLVELRAARFDEWCVRRGE